MTAKVQKDDGELRLTAQSQETATKGHRRGRPKTGEASTTYTDILAAARKEFSDKGFDHVTMRGIAREAGCDPKLVHYYFGSKDQLFATTVAEIIGESHLLDRLQREDATAAVHTGESFVRAFLEFIGGSELGQLYLAMIRDVGSDEHMRSMMVEFVSKQLVSPQIRNLRVDHVQERMMLVGTQMLGLLVVRYVLDAQPLALMSVEQVGRIVGPVVDHYLYDPLPLPPDE
ncbi:putative transcriptional regulator, TetR family protein [Bombiscardovia apis]|uniref:Transcriptional regulator, TetR family protein n=1 Tax=Bombiscardovia apis TaxID=2932182 RepID=A0ABM8BBE9_9BIFI|nr:TetR family transcriptional regulator [Bombiscardovia apis]BDR53922.1 putative transcriptional regulator, TetR family protein [Bombiscardovia apis]